MIEYCARGKYTRVQARVFSSLYLRQLKFFPTTPLKARIHQHPAMLSTIPILLGLYAPFVAAICGTPPPSQNMKSLHASYQVSETEAAIRLDSRQQSLYTMNTNVHVIRAGQDGAVLRSQILDQVLFMPSYVFSIASVRFMVLKKWLIALDKCSQ